MSESKKQTSGTQSRPDNNAGERGRIDGILTIGGILDEQSLRMVVGGATGTSADLATLIKADRAQWDLATAKGA